MGSITEKEMAVIGQFRENVSDLNLSGERNEDLFLIRWLRARDMDLRKAETMLRNHMKWRKEMDFENISTWELPQYLFEEYQYEIQGHSKENCPLLIIPFGRWDVRKAGDLGQKTEYLRYVFSFFEKVMQAIRNSPSYNGVPVTQFMLIYDMDCLSFRQLASPTAVDYILQFVQMFEANYPETLKTCVCVNSSRIFSILYALCKPFLSQKTTDKVKIFTSDPTKWKAVLLKAFSVDQLPVYFGGSRSCTLKCYESNVSNGNNTIRSDSAAEEDFQVAVTVGAGDKLNVEYTIKHPESTLSWSFKTESNDIGFSILHDDTTEVHTYERVDSHLQEHSGSIICSTPGKYVICFDNTYSRMRSKTLRYTVNIESPVEEDSEDEMTRL